MDTTSLTAEVLRDGNRSAAGVAGEVCAMAGELHILYVSRILGQPGWRWRNQFNSSTHSSSTFPNVFNAVEEEDE